MKVKTKAEFGDFQTPLELARQVCERIARFQPCSIIEPTCGRGSFLSAACEAFPSAKRIMGFEINPSHLQDARDAIQAHDSRVELYEADFFSTDWTEIVRPELGPWLVIGNPPWVTSSELGALTSNNLPPKSNFQQRSGLDAITGKANFDISEWMLLEAVNWLRASRGAIAVLCKTAVARKILLQCWKADYPVSAASIYKINALSSFGAAVDACLFVLEVDHIPPAYTCDVFEDLAAPNPFQTLGFDGKHVVSDVTCLSEAAVLVGLDPKYTWRSGVKHDNSKVMELRYVGDALRNGFDEPIDIEREFRFPLLKSSDIGNGRIRPRGEMIVTQKYVGESTDRIANIAPDTWSYLCRFSSELDARGSVIYKKGHRFAIFGVGPYTFAPWKVAISGFYKKLLFVIVPPVTDKPVVFDDTVYFLPCSSFEEASFVHDLLCSEPACRFFQAFVHWDEKRPITASLLKRLSLQKLAENVGRGDEYASFMGSTAFSLTSKSQLPLSDLFAVPSAV